LYAPKISFSRIPRGGVKLQEEKFLTKVTPGENLREKLFCEISVAANGSALASVQIDSAGFRFFAPYALEQFAPLISVQILKYPLPTSAP